ncbi:MAG: cyclic nucleotide-binding domain-containing protein [Gammaproteobacteria bacterium]|nr:cyclic nucleotide-binding domain-containing protein [Gammaproteobacteria bacterium]MBU1777588.1 cyclic nucleotide-binding domain-containing protein [Gammaproteobacteria bacterium]MBU1967682.1 cyclic nucleotide-binding domain-containing protein [Gammaproteobacteria bacterium]
MNLAELFRHETDLLVLKDGQTLFNQGESGDQMYVVMSGTVMIVINNKVVEAAEAGAIVGEMAMIDDGARSATVIAKTDSTLLPIDRKRFSFLVQQTPNFALHVMRVIADRLRRTDATL